MSPADLRAKLESIAALVTEVSPDPYHRISLGSYVTPELLEAMLALDSELHAQPYPLEAENPKDALVSVYASVGGVVFTASRLVPVDADLAKEAA